MKSIEVWDAGGDNSYLYTEDRALAKTLKKKLRRPTVYSRRMIPFGWQFTASSRVVALVSEMIMRGSREVSAQVEEKMHENRHVEIE